MTVLDLSAFFDLDDGPPRDRWQRPMLIPRGGTEADRRWYTRASSLGDKIGDFFFLHTWEKRYLVKGLAQNMDLVRLAAAETYTTGFDKPDDKAGLRANSASGKRLDDIGNRALERAKIHEKADYGTAVHARTEPGNDGVDPDEKQHNDVQSCLQLWADLGVVHLGTEVFTATDQTWSAGTFDHLSYIPGVGICVTDKKTSSGVHADYDIQLAGYANGDVYDYTDDTRMTLEEYVASKGWDPSLLRRDVGFVWWIKNGRTTAHLLDLTAGWQAAQVAAWVRDEHHTKKDPEAIEAELLSEVEAIRLQLHRQIQAAATIGDLESIWSTPQNQAVWTDEHTATAIKRKGELA